MDRGNTFSSRPELLYAAAGPGGPTARCLHRLAAASDTWRPRSRYPLHPAWLYQPDGTELALCRLRRNRANTSVVFWAQGGRTGDRHRGCLQGRKSRAEEPRHDWSRWSKLHHDLLFPRTVSADHLGCGTYRLFRTCYGLQSLQRIDRAW